MIEESKDPNVIDRKQDPESYAYKVIAYYFSGHRPEKNGPLLDAICAKSPRKVKKYLHQFSANSTFFLNKGASKDRAPILSFAIICGSKKIVDILINAGAELNPKKEYTLTNWIHPIHVAIEADNLKMLQFLVSKGSSIKKADEIYPVILNIIQHRISPNILSFVLNHEKNIDVNKLYIYKYEKYQTPLHTAVRKIETKKHATTSYQYLKILLENVANPEIKDTDGKTPLDILPDTSWARPIKKLLQNAVKKNHPEKIMGPRSTIVQRLRELFSRQYS